MHNPPNSINVHQYRAAARHGFERHSHNGVVYYTVPQLSASGRFRSIFTSRIGGVSDGDFDSLNLSVSREKNAENKKENYLRAADAAHVSPYSLVLVNYAHGTGISYATSAHSGEGLSRPTTLPECDALIVREPGVTALSLHADCVPVIAADPVLGIGATAHAGWRGTLGMLPRKLIQVFVEDLGSRPENIICAIGPHIRACSFEVGDDVAAQFDAVFGPETTVRKQGAKPHVDLEAAILMQFADSGILPENVTLADLCTYCEEHLFFSHRRDKGKTGAMGSFMQVVC